MKARQRRRRRMQQEQRRQPSMRHRYRPARKSSVPPYASYFRGRYGKAAAMPKRPKGLVGYPESMPVGSRGHV